MYPKRVVEIGDETAVYDRPSHPYTQALLSAVLHDPAFRGAKERIVLTGDVPSPGEPAQWLPLAPRC